MLQRFPVPLAQLKAGTTTENLLNKIRNFNFSLHSANQILKKVIYSNCNKNGCDIHEFRCTQ